MLSKVAPRGIMHSPICIANVVDFIRSKKIVQCSCSKCVYIRTTPQKLVIDIIMFCFLDLRCHCHSLEHHFLCSTHTLGLQGVKRAQSMLGYCLWNHRTPHTKSYPCTCSTRKSDFCTGARRFKYWTVICITFRLSFACCITSTFMSTVVMCVTWCDIPRCLRSLCYIMMLAAPQLRRPHMHCLLPYLSCIYTLCTMSAQSGVSVLYRYWFNIFVQ